MEVVGADEARARLAAFAAVATEPVALADAAERVLAHDLIAPEALPPWPRSAMDGFAVRAADVASEAALLVVGEVPVGGVHAGAPLAAGQAIAIATGGVVP